MEYIDTPEPGSFAAGLERKESEEEADDQMSEEELAVMKEARAEYDAQKARHKCDDCGKPCEGWLCQDCCPHDEHDHGICLECSKDIMDDIVGAAEMARDAMEDR